MNESEMSDYQTIKQKLKEIRNWCNSGQLTASAEERVEFLLAEIKRQDEKIELLKKTLDYVDDNKKHSIELLSRISLLEKALSFYARKETYWGHGVTSEDFPIDADEGRTAREALCLLQELSMTSGNVLERRE